MLMQIPTMLLFCFILLAALIVPWREGLCKKSSRLIITVLALGIAFTARTVFINYQSGDYNTFLCHWVEYFRQNGGFKGLDGSVGNYNLPYLYFLALFSYIPLNDLHLIKLLSIIFDVVLAFGMMKLTGVFTRSADKRLAAYLITLLLPTVVINGAMWGQCDSIYTAFAVLAFWLVLSGRPNASMVCMALSFGFKLQAVFIMPLYAVLLFAGKIKLKNFLVFPLTYLILILPAVLMGRPFKDAFLLYYYQADTVGAGLNYNSPSLFAFVSGGVNTAALSAVAVAAAFLFVLLIFLWAWKRRSSLNDEALLGIALLFAVGIPFLLPHMHDRYFFMADVLTLLPAVLYAQYAPMTALTSFASFLCYYAYLSRHYLLTLNYGAAALVGVLLILLSFTAQRLNSNRPARSEQKINVTF